MSLEPEQIHDIRTRGQQYQRRTRRLQKTIVILLIIGFGLTLWKEYQISLPGPQAYYFDVGHREWVNKPSSSLEINSVHTFSDNELWHVYREGCWCVERYSYSLDTFDYIYSADFVARNNAFEVVLVQLDETAWAAGPTSLMRFNDGEWTVIRDDLPYQEPAALVSTGSNSVVILNEQETLTHLVNGEARPLALPSDFSGQPSIAAFDGTVWLAGEGLWQLDEATQGTWTKVDPKVGQANTHFHVWKVTEEGVWLSLDTGEVGVYDPADNDFYVSYELTAPIHGVAGDTAPEYIATDSTLYFMGDGGRWESIPLPAAGAVRSLGYTWGFASLTTEGLRPSLFSNSAAKSITSLLSFAPLVLLIIVLFYWIRIQAQRRQRSHKYLMSLLPNLPDYGSEAVDMLALKSVIKWHRFVVFFGLMVAIVVAGILLEVDDSTNALVAVAIGFVYFLWPFVNIMRQAQRSSDKDQRAYARRIGHLSWLMLGSTLPVLFLSMLVLPNMLLPLVHNEVIASTLALVMGFGAGVALLLLLLIIPLFSPIYALRQGDYEQALRRIDKLPRYVPHMTRLSLQGSVLEAAGRWSEATEMWMETLTEIQHQTPKMQSMILFNLSSTLEGLSRYEEAERHCRGALEITPEYDLPYVLTALLAIRNQVSPDLVAQMYAAIPEFGMRPWFNYALQRHTWAFKHAQKALIADYIGQRDEADRLMKTAFDKPDQTFKPGMASLFVVQGTLFMNRQQLEEAHTAFARAIQLDQRGAAGQMAHKAMTDAGLSPGLLPL